MTTLVQEWMYSNKNIQQLADEYGINYKQTRDIIARACEKGLSEFEAEVQLKQPQNEFRLTYQEQLIFDRNLKVSFKDLYLTDESEATVGTISRRCD